MKYLTGYTDPFISPVTGLLARIQPLPDLQLGYVWMGDKDNRPTPSFKLIDLTIDLRSLAEQVDQMAHSTFVLNHPSPVLPKAQVLDQLDDGLMKNVSGLVEIAIPNQDYMVPKLTWKKIWRGDIFGRPEESDDLSELELNFEFLEEKVANLSVRVSEIENWQVAAEAQIEEILIELGNLQAEVVALQAQLAALEAEVIALQAEVAGLAASLAALEAEIAGLSFGLGLLGLVVAGLTLDSLVKGSQISELQSDVMALKFDFYNAEIILGGEAQGRGILNQEIKVTLEPHLPFKHVFVGNILDKAEAQETILPDNLPDLAWGQIWRGNTLDRPVECDDLRDLERKVDETYATIDYIQTQVARLEEGHMISEAQIDEVLQIITLLQSDLLALHLYTASLETKILTLELTVYFFLEDLGRLQEKVAELTLANIIQSLQISALQSNVSSLQNEFVESKVTLVGDVAGVGLLNESVVTKFSPNPVFTGDTLTWPSGNSASRPQNLVAGMFRYNTAPT